MDHAVFGSRVWFPMRSTSHLVLAFVVLLASGCAVTEPGPEGSDTAPLAELVLEDDGLGDVLLGVPPETVIAEISALFGEPDHDSDWIVSEPNIYGSCPGSEMRAIGWGSLLTIFIRDGANRLGGWFYSYSYGYDYSENVGGFDPRGLRLTTAAGVGLGSTVSDLTDAYGSDLTVDGNTELDVWSFRIAGTEIRGLLSGREESDTVTLIELATGCG